MNRSFIVFACLTAILFSITSCKKEDPPSPPSPPSSSDSTWVLTGTKSYTYDISTGEIDDSMVTEIKYQSNPKQIILYENGEASEKFTYTTDGLLSTISSFESGTWVEYFKFNRNSANELQTVNYKTKVNGIWTPSTGYFKTTSTISGKTMQYIDTADDSHNREYYTVKFDASGKASSKKYEKYANGVYYSDWTDPLGDHYYTYDANNNLASFLWASSDDFSHSTDSTTATYIRDPKGNDVLFNYFNTLYGKDLAFWFSKYKIFNDNELHDGGNSFTGGYIESYYNFGKPCTKVVIEDVYNSPATGREVTKEEMIYSNLYDANGNLTSYIETIDGKITEKWVFTYSKL